MQDTATINLDPAGTYIGRVWRPGIGPSVVMVKVGAVLDITSAQFPTVSALLDTDNLPATLASLTGEPIGDLTELEAGSRKQEGRTEALHLLAPCDLQAIKAAGVTFARSMIERVIEERAAGDLNHAEAIRAEVAAIIGGSLSDLVAGSEKAADVKKMLIAQGLWSQYLEVGIGPDAEVFTKAQPMSAVGWGARVGLHPMSNWNNPEPEIVLAVSSRGEVKGACLGNDVNLRDVEGRSALLLGKAKDNNASAAIGPFIRIFDDSFSMADVETAVVTLEIGGRDGFALRETCPMSQISRPPQSIVDQTIGRHHQYPDGFMLYLGSLFAPTKDRDGEGQGFTHHIGDVVSVSCPGLGTLINPVDLSTSCDPWVFGHRALMTNLAGRKLL
ncbi:fumarylacetoacetate hydrolase family protein [Yoonia maritima]|uniref:fumarylacetoacetate hydrolase family protein n=1 Tax=Yoonia maritima TaxID=1435347 RepID=UPI0037367641